MPIFGLLALRYVTLGGYGNAALGVMWIAVLGYVLLFVDRQSRAVVAQIRLRYENEQLVGQLQRQNALAEQARARAEEANRSKSLFFAAANHDLRQPLHSLGLFATALRNNSAGRSSQALVDQILQCTESLEQLFDNLLDISKLDAGQVEVKREIVPVDAVFDRLRSTFSVPAQDKGLRMSVRRSKVDAGHGRDAAVPRAVESRRRTRCATRRTAASLVACRGAATSRRSRSGIPASASRPSSTSASSRSSTSSTIRRAIARAASGSGSRPYAASSQLLGHPLWLRSTRRQGLALHDRSADRRSDARAVRRPRPIEQKVPNLIGGKLIVVIDDEESVRLGMQSLLESWGCKCITAMDSAEALQSINGGARRTSSSPTCVCAAKAPASMRSASCAPSSATRFPPCSSPATPRPSSCARSAPRA